MSHSIRGVSISGLYPYALAIAIALRRAQAKSTIGHLVLDLLLWALFFELCFHCYEAGRFACFVPLIAALSIPRMTWQRRILWSALSLAMAYLFFFSGGLSIDNGKLSTDVFATLATIPEALKHVWLALGPMARLDYPFVLIAAMLSLFSIKKFRAFWAIILLLQFATLVALAALGVLWGETGPELLRARRYSATAFILAMIVGYAWNHGLSDHRTLRKFVILFVAMGLAAVTTSSFKFYLEPSQMKSLPFTESSVDLHIDPQMNEDARRVATFADKQSSPIFVLYGYGDRAENTTDPNAFPERVLLHLGPRRFLERVVFISRATRCRYSCVPMTAPFSAYQLLANLGGDTFLFLPRAATPAWDPPLVTAQGALIPGTWLSELLTQYNAKPQDLGLSKFSVLHLESAAVNSLVTPFPAVGGPIFSSTDDRVRGRTWKRHSWDSVEGGSEWQIKDNEFHLVNTKDADQKLIRRVTIEPGQALKFEAEIKTRNVRGSRAGAFICIMDTYWDSHMVKGTTDWQPVQLIVANDTSESREIPFCLRLGHYGATVSGEAWFRNVTAYPVEIDKWQGFDTIHRLK